MSNESQTKTIDSFIKEVKELDTTDLITKMLMMSKALNDSLNKDNIKTLLFMNQVICLEVYNRVLAHEMLKEINNKAEQESKKENDNNDNTN